MGRKVEKKSKDGKLTFKAEFVGKVPPISDKDPGKTIFLRELDPDRLKTMTSVSGCAWAVVPLAELSKQYGDKVWEIGKDAMKNFAYKRAMQTLKAQKVDVTDARALGRWMDFEDNILGIEGEYVVYTKKKAVRRQFNCPWADMITANHAEGLCTYMMGGYMLGVREAMIELGAKLKDLPSKIPMITLGDPYCELIWELKD
jgi:hypothetical protein